MVQRRRSERISSCIRVRWIRAGEPLEGVATNINEHGLFLRIRSTARSRDLVRLEIDLPGGTIRGMGVVRYAGATPQGSGMGIELYQLAGAERRSWLCHYQRLRDRSLERRAIIQRIARAVAPVSVGRPPGRTPARSGVPPGLTGLLSTPPAGIRVPA